MSHQGLVLHHGLVDGPSVRGEDLGSHVCVPVALLLRLLLCIAFGSLGRGSWARKGAQETLAFVVFIFRVVVLRRRNNFELWRYNVGQELLEDFVPAEVIYEFRIMLLELLNEVALIE
ncbi:hypothetical protein HYQ46_001807 [Verticillium longisporum]|nr:hypothetical protein HYQ46_001807 [Verticillium longisporum]